MVEVAIKDMNGGQEIGSSNPARNCKNLSNSVEKVGVSGGDVEG
jgi:hypothetical protein